MDTRIIKRLKKNDPSLHEINLSSCSLTAKKVSKIARALLKHGSIVRINLNDNPIGDVGLTVILEAIVKTVTVKSVLLDKIGTLSAVGANEIGRFILSYPYLEELSISYNGIGDDLVHYVFQDSSRPITIQTLCMSSMRIRDTGALAIANAIRGSSTLRKILLIGA
eukprot:TRINITY_DN1276_c1_g1_i5.p1 TRINITY_DN1276_c1_g1~~TRINITY_DN1276_c1_g1_i5.p1  ORF type:complete len:166 (-),score=21.79 TRINITY_DN1276_c1_g1_i5:21-518(-)